MSERSAHVLETDAAAGITVVGSTTGPRSRTVRASRPVDSAGMFGDVPAPVRLRMQLIACASPSPELALPDVIALLVPGTAAKQATIVDAITSNGPLREQWERTWHILRP